MKKLNNWKFEKVYLVLSECLLVVFGCLLVVCGPLLVIFDYLLWFVLICGGLWLLPVLVTIVMVVEVTVIFMD